MPRACPACGRPNSDQAARCLYCTEPFGVAAPDESIEATVLVSKRHLIILAPQEDGRPDRERLQSIAEVLGLTSFDARLALRTKRYRFLRKVEGREEASEISSRLERLGVKHLELSEADVEALPIRSVRWLRFHGSHLELHFSDKGSVTMSYPDILLLVRGEIAKERHHERRMATTRGASQSLTPGLRLLVFDKSATATAELDPEQFDWSALEEWQSSSTPINFQRLIDEILHRAGGAQLDRGFDLEPVVLSRSGVESTVEALLEGSKRREGVTYDNEAQFRFYGRWRYLVARATTGGERN